MTTVMADKQRDICDLREGDMEIRPWADLHIDILNEIKGRLSLFDQFRFRGVCKPWRLAKHGKPAHKLPWLMTYDLEWDNNGDILSNCTFHCPFLNKTFTYEHKIEEERCGNLFAASFCASKYGWLLLQRSEKAFVYHPLTKEIIKLPDMGINFNRSTFSSIPTLPDCVFFAVQTKTKNKMLCIKTCHHGDLRWRKHIYCGFKLAIEDVVYSNGTFYCVFSGGVLGAYSVAFEEWKLLTDTTPILDVRSEIRMVESDGDLLLVYPSLRFFHIFRFDWSLMTWVEQDSLGNKALLLGCTSYSISAEKETSALADKIYYHGHENTFFYSLKTHESHKCSEFYPWVTRRAPEKIWIEPL
ncbi:unnamed protein product, partial [Ilex paraguariensis]